jgi:succinyl-CoA synthetase alpha subunit
MRRYKKEDRMCLTGPNCAGTISPGKAMMGIMPGHIYMQGNVGLIGRSGTLGYETASQMKAKGIGISTSAGESAAEKVEILREAGIGIIVRPSEFGNAVEEALANL